MADVLAIHQRRAFKVSAEHRANADLARAELVMGHAHDPVRADELAVAGVARLRIEADEQIAVKHELPTAARV